MQINKICVTDAGPEVDLIVNDCSLIYDMRSEYLICIPFDCQIFIPSNLQINVYFANHAH